MVHVLVVTSISSQCIVVLLLSEGISAIPLPINKATVESRHDKDTMMLALMKKGVLHDESQHLDSVQKPIRLPQGGIVKSQDTLRHNSMDSQRFHRPKECSRSFHAYLL